MGSQFGFSSSTSASESFAPARGQESRNIERRIAEFVTAWNKHDPVQMAALWAEDGDLINPFGRLAKGRQQVEQLFRDEHASPMKSCRNEMAIASQRWVADNVVVVDADCTMMGIRGADGKELPTFNPHVVLVMGKTDGDWQILAARPYAFRPALGQGN